MGRQDWVAGHLHLQCFCRFADKPMPLPAIFRKCFGNDCMCMLQPCCFPPPPALSAPNQWKDQVIRVMLTGRSCLRNFPPAQSIHCSANVRTCFRDTGAQAQRRVLGKLLVSELAKVPTLFVTGTYLWNRAAIADFERASCQAAPTD